MEATPRTDEYEHTSSGIIYIATNIPGPGIDIDEFESEFSVGCSCSNNCFNGCDCTGPTVNYQNDCIIENRFTQTANPVIECNVLCNCGATCGNRTVQKGPLDCLKITEMGSKGFGLTTTKCIKKGQFVCEYAGEVIGLMEAQSRVEMNKKHKRMNYVLVVSEHIGEKVLRTCIDPQYFGNIGRYCNHSCNPNAILVPVRFDGPIPHLCLFAKRDIEINEEITFDYAGGEGSNSVHTSETPCLCGSDICLGYLPHDPI